MESAKDYGFNEGYVLDVGTDAPSDYTVIDSVNNGQPLAIPNTVLAQEYLDYSETLQGRTQIPSDPIAFGPSFKKAKAVMNLVGIGKYPNTGMVKVGSDFKGQAIYSNPKLTNDTSTKPGKTLAETTGMSLGAMGAFSGFSEAQRYMAVGEKANDPLLHAELDNLKQSGDVHSFIEKVGGDSRADTEFSAYKLYENWNNLSPAQKSLGISSTGTQGFKFDDGNTFETKRLTPEIPGVPSMNAAEALDLASRGVNMAPATRHWNQLSTIQETFYAPKKSADVATTSNSLGLLGYGIDGRAVPIDETILSKSQAQIAPHFGVGAITVPQGTGVMKGYIPVKNVGNKTIMIPESTRGTSVINTPDVATKSAADIYNRWDASDRPARQDQGVIGGSALVGGLQSMAGNNPYTLGAVMTQSSFEHAGISKDATDMQHVTGLAGVTLNRLVKGQATKDVDTEGLSFMADGNFDEQSYDGKMKELRGEYAKRGVSSKEIAYQLANQAFAERRFNASQLTSAHKTIDMVFDDNSYTLAQKLNTGKSKGIEILEKRRRG